MADQVLTKYGPLDLSIAAVVRQRLERMLLVVFVDLSEANLALAGTGGTTGADIVESPASRWARLMIELFGEHESQLLHQRGDIDDHACTSASISVVRDVISAVSLFLVAEANAVQRQIGETTADRVDGGRDALEQADKCITAVFSSCLALNHLAADTSLADLFDRSYIAATRDLHEVISPKTSVESAARLVTLRLPSPSRLARSKSGDGQPGYPGFQRALEIFHRAAAEVPAYGRFLAEHGITAAEVRTPEEFATIPPVTTSNYLKRYPLDSLLWPGKRADSATWSTNLGAISRSSRWPQAEGYLVDGAAVYDRLFRKIFQSHRYSTLFILATGSGKSFGLMTALALRSRAQRVSVVAPGINVDSLLSCLNGLAPHYEQTVLVGYPQFVKDVLDRASDKIRYLSIRLLIAGDGITEGWRTHMLERLDALGRPEQVSVVYATAATGPLGYETDTTIYIRKLAQRNPALTAALNWAKSKQPTFVEYNPHRCYIENDSNRTLLFTMDSAVPLVRYQSPDLGCTHTMDSLAQLLGERSSFVRGGLSRPRRGFLSVEGRADSATRFYAAKIHPRTVREALTDELLAERLSGRFLLTTELDDTYEQLLRLRVEVRRRSDIGSGLASQICERVTDTLRKTNSEYNWLHSAIGARAEPSVSLHPAGTLRPSATTSGTC